jgi:PAT family acetyl-CoA transporter-like MFS transporter 1
LQQRQALVRIKTDTATTIDRMKRRPPSMAHIKDHHSTTVSSSDIRGGGGVARPKISGMVSRLVPGRGEKPSKLSLADINTDNEEITPPPPPSDKFNYALLIVLYTLQGIPMGLSASIPFLLQEKIQKMAVAAASAAAATGAGTAMGPARTAATAAAVAAEAARASYNANAIFALCSWPFSMKLLWAPIVDSVYFKRFGRRKSWLVPVQTLAGLIMLGGSDFVEKQLGLGNVASIADGGTSAASTSAAAAAASMNVQGVTAFFFVLYFLMATQDIAVDGWALTMLSKKNRGRGPICNSIGQNIGYFLSFVGFLALNDVESANTIWRPLFRLPQNPNKGLVSLKGFLRFMGSFMLVTTAVVAIFKREIKVPQTRTMEDDGEDEGEGEDDAELDASEIGLRETYHRLWAVSRLPAVRWLFVVLVTYRLPVALSDNVKFLKAVELGLSKSTTALLSPTLILPLGILVPLVASKIWHSAPLRQFMRAYEWRITIVPLLDVVMLRLLRNGHPHNTSVFWGAVVASTACQAITSSLQFNAQMTFFASRVDPAIGGSYMTLLNTMANLGGTWPASFVMKLLSWLTPDGSSSSSSTSSSASSWFGGDPYELVQIIFTVLGILWVIFLGPVVRRLAALPDDAWRTHLLDNENGDDGTTTTATTTATTNIGHKPEATSDGARKRSNAKTLRLTTMSAMESGMDVGRWKQAKNDGKIE